MQRTLPIPGDKSKQQSSTSRQPKISSSNDKPDLSRKPSDTRWESDMVRVTNVQVTTSGPFTVDTTDNVRKRGSGNLRKAPKRTDAYSPTTAAQKDQWERKPAYVPVGDDLLREKDIFIVQAVEEKAIPFSHGEIKWHDEPAVQADEKHDTPTVQKVIAAHMDT